MMWIGTRKLRAIRMQLMSDGDGTNLNGDYHGKGIFLFCSVIKETITSLTAITTSVCTPFNGMFPSI